MNDHTTFKMTVGLWALRASDQEGTLAASPHAGMCICSSQIAVARIFAAALCPRARLRMCAPASAKLSQLG